MHREHISISFRRISILAAIVAAHCVISCNNYGLLDKLENPGGTAELKSHYIFVSSIKTTGMLTMLTNGGCNNASGALAQADCSCREMARSAGLLAPDSYIAWLSTGTIWAKCRLQGINTNACGTSAIISWYNRKNQIVASSLAELTGGTGIANPIKYTEYGVETMETQVLTGTNSSGSNAPNTCTDWAVSTNAMSFDNGNPNATTIDWSQIGSGQITCDNPRPIYCIRKI